MRAKLANLNKLHGSLFKPHRRHLVLVVSTTMLIMYYNVHCTMYIHKLQFLSLRKEKEVYVAFVLS